MFTFHANALGFGGQIVRGKKRRTLSSEASVALSPSGGDGSATVRNYCDEDVSFDEAHTSVWGGSSPDDSVFTTHASVHLTNLDLLEAVHVDIIEATVTSIHQREEECDEPKIMFNASLFGLTINGERIDTTFDTQLFSEHPTYDSFGKFFESIEDEKMAMQMIEQFGWNVDDVSTLVPANADTKMPARRKFQLPSRCGMPQAFRASLLRSTSLARNPIDGVRKSGMGIEVDGLGTLYLGEVLVKRGRRRLNMLRVELGSPKAPLAAPPPSAGASGVAAPVSRMMMRSMTPLADGSAGQSGGVTFGSVEGNGTDYLP
ncbi:MAG: hypothetical protein JWN02_724 [Acidobacteria bacterium]|nr:hypothetical protein [Acidobacteriota bacterium]